MSKKYMYLFGAALLALSGVGASTSAVNAKGVHHARRTNVTRMSNRYFVNAPASISSSAHTITGTATAGSYVMLQNGSKTVSSTYAGKNGRYVLSVPNLYKAGTNLRVVAKKGYWHPYKMVTVKTPANQKAAVRANRKNSRRPIKKLGNRVHKVAKRHAKKSGKKSVTKKAPKAVKHNRLADQINKLQNQMKALVTRNTKESKEYNGDKTQLNKLENQYKAAQKSSIKRSVKQSRVKAVKSRIAQLNQEVAKLENQLKGNTRKVVKKAPVKRNAKRSTRKTKSAKLAQSPNGNWTARQSKHYMQKWSFSQDRGLNESLYHNGRYAKKLVTNAPYKLDSIKPNFWKITYTPQKTNKSNSFYMHLLTNNRFQVTNARGRHASLNFVRA